MRGRSRRARRLVILVPQGPGVYGTLDEVLGHERRYTRATLDEACARARLRVESCSTSTGDDAGWWFNGRSPAAAALRQAAAQAHEPVRLVPAARRLLAAVARRLADRDREKI
jgi:hypothetical protein